jgi:hypothetical protein
VSSKGKEEEEEEEEEEEASSIHFILHSKKNSE